MIGCIFGGMDSSGIIGQIFHYALVFAIMGMALFFLIYLWKKDRLDMDESPKYQMLKKEDTDE
ncbi:MAG: hypothetical protein P4L16_08185 [Chlamydiales bacterium]|nr:hypothetical protein [Chlamydiales bacterium]